MAKNALKDAYKELLMSQIRKGWETEMENYNKILKIFPKPVNSEEISALKQAANECRDEYVKLCEDFWNGLSAEEKKRIQENQKLNKKLGALFEAIQSSDDIPWFFIRGRINSVVETFRES